MTPHPRPSPPAGRYPRRGRRGVNLVGLLLALACLLVISLAISQLARQSGRSSHWFYLSQASYRLADSATKEVAFLLTEANSLPRARDAPFLSGPLVKIMEAIQGLEGAPGTRIPLFGENSPGLSPGLERHLTRMALYSPEFSVWAEVHQPEPLWDGNLGGIPSDPRERRGLLQIGCSAAVTDSQGFRVERTVVLERPFRCSNILPPGLGRFTLFVAERGGADPNVVQTAFTSSNGDAVPSGGDFPLRLDSGQTVPLVAPGGANLTRAVAGLPSTLLDEQGWVHLGSGGDPWELRLAHGFGPVGESFLLPGVMSQAPFQGPLAGFPGRFAAPFGAVGVPHTPSFSGPGEGLFLFHHGFARNYHLIGLARRIWRRVQSGGVPTKVLLGPGDVSALRLFGTPEAASPTLVFGPVQSSFLQRAMLRMTLTSKAGPSRHSATLNVWPMADYGGSAGETFARSVLAAGYQGADATHGTRRIDDWPTARLLEQALAAGPNGTYGSTGVLAPTAGGPGPTFRSQHVPAVEVSPGAARLSPEALEQLWRGELDLPGVFQGSLGGLLPGFQEVLSRKVTFRVSQAPGDDRFAEGGVLRIPGVALNSAPGDLVLPAINRVREGGLLIQQGNIVIEGDLVNDDPAEPVTLVAMGGDISLGSGVRRVDAYLVAIGGTVRFPATPFEVQGGVAMSRLDTASLAGQSPDRVIRYQDRFDVARPEAREPAYRVYFGGPRRSVGARES